MSTVETTTCAVCTSPAEEPVECRCGAVHCRACIDGHECPAPVEIVLRDEQVSLVRGVHDMIRAGHKRILVVAPTGFGKRLVWAWWTKKAAEKGRHVLVGVNRRQLVRQFSDELKARGVPHNVTMGSETTADRGELVVVASIQTLRSRHFFHPDTGERDGTGLPPADIILVDEGHLDLRTYKALFDFYPNAIILGNTATPVGPGGKACTDVWPAMYLGVPKSELIQRGRLVPTRMYAPSEPNMEGVKITKGNYAAGEAEQRVRECTVFANVFNEWLPWSDLPTVAFVPGVEFARWMAKEWDRRGFSAVCVDAKTKPKERQRIFEGVKDGSIRIVVSVDVLKIGVDCPPWTVAVDIQPTLQLRDFIQKSGRICRAYEGKTEGIYLDFSGSFWRHGHPDQDIAWDELRGDETTADLIAKARKKPGSPQPIRCPKCTHVRKHGSQCPQCGFEYAKVTRLVRMGDGSVKRMAPPRPKEKKAPTAKGTPEWRNKHWKGALFAAGRSNRTLSQARKIYKDNAGEWPPYGLDLMPPHGSTDWGRKVSEVYPWTNKRKAKA